MPLLTVNYSESLAGLIKSDQVVIDGIEVGPWFKPGSINEFRNAFPEIPFYYHASSLVSRIKVGEKWQIRLEEYLEATQSPWVSIHIELLPLGIFQLGKYLGIHLPPPDAQQSARRFVEILARIKTIVQVPILLENLPCLPSKRYNNTTNPEILANIVHATGASLLLDIAHARVAASVRNQDPRSYLERMPLEKVAQVHISGVRSKNGYLYDAHASLQEEDYQLLKWVLERSQPQVVTLEFIQEREALGEQVLRLQEMVSSARRSGI